MGRGMLRREVQGEPLRMEAVQLEVSSGPHCYPCSRVEGMPGSVLPSRMVHRMKELALESPGMSQVQEGVVATYCGEALV